MLLTGQFLCMFFYALAHWELPHGDYYIVLLQQTNKQRAEHCFSFCPQLLFRKGTVIRVDSNPRDGDMWRVGMWETEPIVHSSALTSHGGYTNRESPHIWVLAKWPPSMIPHKFLIDKIHELPKFTGVTERRHVYTPICQRKVTVVWGFAHSPFNDR